MKEIIVAASVRAQLRWSLLTSASALALVGAALQMEAAAAETDRPTVWIELGGQLEQIQTGEQPFEPEFDALAASAGFTAQSIVRKRPKYSYGIDGKISLQPGSSDWIFSAAIRYGRANGSGRAHQQLATQITTQLIGVEYGIIYSDAVTRHQESHGILDFQVGKDVGIGMFGRELASVVNVGLRIAQFESRSSAELNAKPNYFGRRFIPRPINKYLMIPYHSSFHASSRVSRSFKGVGPSISWDGAIPLAGSDSSEKVTFDLGLNAAVLFGRQRANVHHQTIASHYSAGLFSRGHTPLYQNRPADSIRGRNVTVPNIGGFAGFSMRYSNAKVSLGYRADLFFDAMDGGMDIRSSSGRDFYGPFASVSIGIGG